jgi:hypothetical protein
MKIMKILSLLAVVLAYEITTFAGTISIPSTTVNGTDVFSGPTLTLTSQVNPTDTLTLTTSGQVFLQGASAYGTNPAGVVTTAGTTGVGGSSANGSTTFGALLFGNSTFGFVQVYPTNAADGLGSLTPPSSLTVAAVSFSSLGFSTAMPSGTVLQFRVSDINTGDNFGSFTVSGSINTASGVPEPSSVAMVLAGLAALGGFRYRRR